MGAIAIGAIAGVPLLLRGPCCAPSSGLDDSLDVVGVHGVGGIWGAMRRASSARGGQLGGADGLIDGGGFDQLGRQFVAVVATLPTPSSSTFVILKVLDMTMGLRVKEEDEIVGLDVSQHGERAYILGGSGSSALRYPDAHASSRWRHRSYRRRRRRVGSAEPEEETNADEQDRSDRQARRSWTT